MKVEGKYFWMEERIEESQEKMKKVEREGRNEGRRKELWIEERKSGRQEKIQKLRKEGKKKKGKY